MNWLICFSPLHPQNKLERLLALAWKIYFCKWEAYEISNPANQKSNFPFFGTCLMEKEWEREKVSASNDQPHLLILQQIGHTNCLDQKICLPSQGWEWRSLLQWLTGIFLQLSLNHDSIVSIFFDNCFCFHHALPVL